VGTLVGVVDGMDPNPGVGARDRLMVDRHAASDLSWVIDRRSWGIALVAVVIILAIVVPAWGGRHVSGSAQASQPPQPPQVGDCIYDVPSSRSALDYMPPVMAARTARCDDANIGEIVAVATDVGSFPRTVENGMGRPEALACDPLVRQYVGWPAETAGNAMPADWRPLNTVSFGLLGPDLQQYFAGQRWVACVAYPQFAPFSGSTRDTVHNGRSASSLAACQPISPTSAGQIESCKRPHRSEIFGWTSASAGEIDLQASCTQLVQRVTAMSDVTAGGAVRVVVTSASQPAAFAAGTPPAGNENRMLCSVSVDGSRRLVDTLIGIGNADLPWE
jgi:hypothetical protein